RTDNVLDFRIFGPLEIVEDGAPLRLGGRMQRVLLGLLLLRAGEVVSTDVIVDALWGDSPPKNFRASLLNLVSPTRGGVGSETIETRPPGYVLRAGPEQIDLARFERKVAAARTLAASDRSTELAEALSMWRGTPLADLSYEAFAQGEILRLE